MNIDGVGKFCLLSSSLNFNFESDSENEILSCDKSTKPYQYAVCNVKRREKHAKTRIVNLQRSVR